MQVAGTLGGFEVQIKKHSTVQGQAFQLLDL